MYVNEKKGFINIIKRSNYLRKKIVKNTPIVTIKGVA